jgi:RNA polymerase sigma factor (sigma-70 family)
MPPAGRIIAMSTAAILRHLRSLKVAERTDCELLRAFAFDRDESAFTALVQRHGPLVLGVCRRLLGQEQDAEDAFQATFLVLARKAASLPGETVGGWLHGVAWNMAQRVRRATARQHARETQASMREMQGPVGEASLRELQALLDAEVARLPEKLRGPFVLCCLEGRSKAEAARELGWKEGTVSSRLAQARERLRARLVRRGVTLTAALTALAVDSEAHAVSPSLLRSMEAVGRSTANAVSPAAVALAEGMRTSGAALLYKAAMLVVVAGIVTLGGYWAATGETPQSAEEAQPKTENKQPNVDRFGDALPPGALARMGSVRWRLDIGGAAQLVVPADGKTVIAANGQTGVSIFDLVTGRVMRQLPSNETLRKALVDSRHGVGLSGDGRLVAFGTREGLIHLLDLVTDKELRSLTGHRGRIQEVSLSHDGRALVSRSEDKTLRVWDTAARKQLHEISLEPKSFTQEDPSTVAMAPNGKEFAWIGNDKERIIHACDAATGQEKHRLDKHEGDLRQIVYSPDSRWLASTSSNGRIQLWDLKSGGLRHTWTSGGSHGLPYAAFAPDGKTLVVRRGGDGMRLLDLSEGKVIWHHKDTFMSTVRDAFTFTPDGKKLLAAPFGGPVLYRHDMTTGKFQRSPGEQFEGFQDAAFSADEKRLNTVQWDGVWRTWETDTGKELHQLALNTKHSAFSPDGKLLAVVREGLIHLYDTAAPGEPRTLPTKAQRIGAIAFAPHGRTLLVAGEAEGPVLWDATTAKELRRLPTGGRTFSEFGFSADGRTLVAYGRQAGELFGFVQLWDAATGRPRGPVQNLPERDFYMGMILSPDARTLVLSADNQHPSDLMIWEIATGRNRLIIHERFAMRPPVGRFSPDGSLLLVPEPDALTFYDPFTGQALHREPGHPGITGKVYFSPSGRLLATTQLDFTVLIWKTAEFVDPKRPKPVPLSRDELAAAWADLANEDAEKAYAALGKMARSPDEAVPWVRERVRPAQQLAEPDPKRLEKLLAALDSDEFPVRKQAAADLEKLGEAALPFYQRVLNGTPSTEVRASIERLKAKCQQAMTRDGLLILRAVEMLEHCRTQEARQLLAELAKGWPEARLTREAKASLERLSRRAR